MTDISTAEPRCPACGTRWIRSGDRWLVTDIHGRVRIEANGGRPLRHYPVCKALVVPEKATVREEAS